VALIVVLTEKIVSKLLLLSVQTCSWTLIGRGHNCSSSGEVLKSLFIILLLVNGL